MKARQEFGTPALYEEYMVDEAAHKAMQAELTAQVKDGQVYLWKDPAALAQRAYDVAEAMWREKQNRKTT